MTAYELTRERTADLGAPNRLFTSLLETAGAVGALKRHGTVSEYIDDGTHYFEVT